MNWEMVGWIVLAGSAAIILSSFFVGRDQPALASGKKLEKMEPESGTGFQLMLEISWPALFISAMALLTFKEVMGFAAVLLLATTITGLVWLVDSLFLKKRRVAGTQEPALVEMARSFFPVILIVFLLRSFLYEPFKIPSGSMVPTLLVGDFILVNKYTYGVRIPVINKKIMDMNLPKRSDVMVFRYPVDPSKDYIKRVIGIPGDVISYKNKRLTVNGVAVATEETGTFIETEDDNKFKRYYKTYKETLGDKPHAMMVDPRYPNIDLASVRQFPNKSACQYSDEGMTCTVPAGHYLMIGDSRDNSLDGRFWGFVPEENIVGKAVAIWMNFGDFKRVGTAIQ
jgi:signal peptidase I